MMLPAPEVALIPVKADLSESELLGLLDRLENHPQVLYANPFSDL